MEQTDLDLQLKVWKDLAISKQVLMQTATKALGLNADCSAAELEEALKKTISQAKSAEIALQEAKDKAQTDVSVLEAQIAKRDISINEITTEKDEAIDTLKSSEERRELAKTASTEEIKKLKTQLSDKQKEIKQITKILADTPENVAKKVKNLKKDKMDEANSRKKAEEVSRNLRKEKQRVEQKLEESKSAVKQANDLVTKHRELNSFANEQYNQLAELVEDKKSLEQVPYLDEELLEAIEAAVPEEDKDKDKEKAKKDTKKKKK